MIVEITKVSISKRIEKLYTITLNLKLKDGDIEILNQNFNQDYRPGEDLKKIMDNFQSDIQSVIDSYNYTESLLSDGSLEASIETLKNNLIA